MPGYNSQVAQMSDGGAATAGGMIVDGHNSSSEYEGNTSYAPRAPLNLPKTPRKLGRKPPVKGHKRETLYDIARRVPVSIMREYFNFSLRQAADAMSISVTSLKRLCRRHGVKRWPHRQLSGLNRAVTHLEEKQQTSSDPTIAEQLHQLYSRRDVIIDQAFTSDDTGSEPRRDSPSRSDNEEGDVLLEQDEALTPPRVAENPTTTIPRLQREPGTTWTHEQQHQQKQPQQQQQQHPSSDHDREFEAVEGAKARGREDYPTRGWGRSSMSPDRRRNSSKPVSMGGGHSGFRASNPPPSSAVPFAPEATPEQSQARRSPQNPLSRAGSAVDATADVSSGASNIGNGTHPSRPREKVSSLPTHVATLPQQRSSGNAEAPITKIAVLNALLLGGGPSEGPASPGSLSRARATAGGAHPRRRRCSEGPKEGGGGGGGGGGAWGRTQDDMSGPLPSIARLVEAGALLSGAGESDWR